jgi:hypothetical protein
VTVKTVFERSKIPLTKWLAALFLLSSSKKRMSTHQMHRILDISYKSTWFMTHRLREAMRAGDLAPLGEPGSIVEVDETFIGRLEGVPQQRKGYENIRKESRLMTDEGRHYKIPWGVDSDPVLGCRLRLQIHSTWRRPIDPPSKWWTPLLSSYWSWKGV